ncbi:CPBP family intramembrane glutamic endopeptidase [Clostridium luticellarii]|uniref:CAAX amino terminal protease self-immunity n=1 Tax=Clostridium luticellarii TaxID=1691940 RepID=A0A2T0BQ97_9CLOT|nr:type II CAAX endopeptidase family protein [Clostridium luticellarii]MCI1944452.1 CPBP family intramembrane metalloprotease [Clostridium luticellarii]MCI1967951.1 CPBP family intramembrane metalloprotease [Clostridium luticellarii]MCI1995110.1 CPBP family intramembrane metalloprotease [Clostridium luticellarii]MCI2039269.1 CPBP family intramembrane metalloprotease [Clostridium luticellarii]PRR86049.1 CAAX amino terminal protease self- immunity [Clostridium luticellarii]
MTGIAAAVGSKVTRRELIMFGFDIIKNILVFVIVYLPPLLVFARFWRQSKRNSAVLILISVFYIALSIFTENFIPFIFVIINLWYIKHTDESYRFSFENFKIPEALKMVFIFYLASFFISAVENVILSNFRVELKQQEIVTHMANMPLEKFLIMIPIVIIFAPVLEEFVFRWLIFEKIFAKKVGIYLAAFLSSLLFAIIHFSLDAFPIILWIGLYNCYLMNKKGYWYAVFNHCVFNSITIAALLLQKLS